MARNMVETIMGAVVLLVAAIFVVLAYDTAQVGAVQGYQITAPFYKVGGLQNGSDVRINGIKVGTVAKRWLSPETYDAMVRMTIRTGIKLPTDTVASIGNEGILGGKYVRLDPGTAKTFVAAGGSLTKTKDFRSLEDQVGEIIFLATSSDTKSGDK
jgi:phospholipid/cholesterol/gamma-HCH transport system substrate-binding protein